MDRTADINIIRLDERFDFELLDIIKDAADSCEDIDDFYLDVEDIMEDDSSDDRLPDLEETTDKYVLRVFSSILDDASQAVESADRAWQFAMLMFNCASLALPDKFWKSSYDRDSHSFLLGAYMDDDSMVAIVVKCNDTVYDWFKTAHVHLFSDDLLESCTSLFDPSCDVLLQSALQSECATADAQFVLHYPNGDRVELGDSFFAGVSASDPRSKPMKLTAVTIADDGNHYLYSGNTGYSLSVCEPAREGMQTTYNVAKRNDEFECAKCHKKIEIARKSEIVYCPFCGRRIM